MGIGVLCVFPPALYQRVVICIRTTSPTRLFIWTRPCYGKLGKIVVPLTAGPGSVLLLLDMELI